MDSAKGGINGGGGGGGVGSGNTNSQKIMSEGEAEALKKCLEENKGEESSSSRLANCKSKVEAFRSSSPPHPKNKPLGPLRLRSGSLTDV